VSVPSLDRLSHVSRRSPRQCDCDIEGASSIVGWIDHYERPGPAFQPHLCFPGWTGSGIFFTGKHRKLIRPFAITQRSRFQGHRSMFPESIRIHSSRHQRLQRQSREGVPVWFQLVGLGVGPFQEATPDQEYAGTLYVAENDGPIAPIDRGGQIGE
jgi:hypothetical protein